MTPPFNFTTCSSPAATSLLVDRRTTSKHGHVGMGTTRTERVSSSFGHHLLRRIGSQELNKARQAQVNGGSEEKGEGKWDGLSVGRQGNGGVHRAARK
ncbi:unnamed protein product [Dovyalis caffra]|uniref:Uncharacterized protein n=1 Tax=Dovyalis caffra TaxID=77055 RepID=A0AAV1SNS7_9ROSI|nr:unnamed protein product [Dovyalis caffra]